MTSPSFNPFPAEVNAVAGITRCIRRICLLREQGNEPEAKQLEQSDLANAIRDLRLAQGPDAFPESELRKLFSAEEKRVADAVLLSELLIPELVKSFPAGASNPPVTKSVSPTKRPFGSQESATPFPPAMAAAGGSPAIADMLDSMFASERSPRRS